MSKALESSVDILAARYGLKALFAPEHGIRGDAQAGENVAFTTDWHTGLPVHSLYGDRRYLSGDMVRGLDMLIFDMQDVGVRYFTYLYTLAHVMEGAAQFKFPLVVLDRVNPLNGSTINGTVLDERFASFVGEYAIPVRYGLTIGEFARYVNSEKGIHCDLTVIPCGGWQREMYFDDTDLPWVMPSPNMPTTDTALCYPGTCLFEGTNVSEGRGTTKPFELIGAPWIDPVKLVHSLSEIGLGGVLFRPAYFKPAFSKHAGELCCGVQLHVTDRAAYDPFLTGLCLVNTIRREYKEFEFIETGGGKHFIDLLLGSDAMRKPGFDVGEFIAANKTKLERYLDQRHAYLIY